MKRIEWISFIVLPERATIVKEALRKGETTLEKLKISLDKAKWLYDIKYMED